jgi:RNA polymerase sigma-70 factor (ECF subfamily)
MTEALAQVGTSAYAQSILADDRELVARIGQGDRDALAELSRRHQSSLFFYLLRLVGDPEVAEEVLQDSLVAAWQGAIRFEGRSKVLTWLVGIARRQAHNTLRRRGLPLVDLAEVESLPSLASGPEDQAVANAEREQLAAAMRRLVPAHREVLVLTFVHSLSYREMAEVVGVPEGTIKSRLSNAKRALRVLLEQGVDNDS